jgi:hypothetical protein
MFLNSCIRNISDPVLEESAPVGSYNIENINSISRNHSIDILAEASSHIQSLRTRKRDSVPFNSESKRMDLSEGKKSSFKGGPGTYNPHLLTSLKPKQ